MKLKAQVLMFKETEIQNTDLTFLFTEVYICSYV